MYTDQERRQYPRYRAEDMTATISFQDESSRTIIVEKVKPLDFNSHSIAFETNLDFKIDSKMAIDISRGRYYAPEIICTVRSAVRQGDKNRYGLIFDFTANEYMCSKELEETLANIQDALKKHQHVPARRTFRIKKARERRLRIKILGR